MPIELHAKLFFHQVGDHLVVVLGGRNGCTVKNLSVDGSELPVVAHHAVEHSAVGVQVRLSCTVIPVHELRRDHAVGVNFLDSTLAGTGEKGVVFDPVKGVFHGLLVGCHDLFAHVFATNCP